MEPYYCVIVADPEWLSSGGGLEGAIVRVNGPFLTKEEADRCASDMNAGEEGPCVASVHELHETAVKL